MAIKDIPSGLFTCAQRLVDRVVTPDTRSQFYSNVNAFAHEQPILASFLLIQILLSATPLLIFLSFTIGTILLSLFAAALFSFFWLSIATLVLLPTLFLTTSLATILFLWALSSFLIARWLYTHSPVSVKGSTSVALPNGKKAVVTKGQGNGDFKGDVKDMNKDGF